MIHIFILFIYFIKLILIHIILYKMYQINNSIKKWSSIEYSYQQFKAHGLPLIYSLIIGIIFTSIIVIPILTQTYDCINYDVQINIYQWIFGYYIFLIIIGLLILLIRVFPPNNSKTTKLKMSCLYYFYITFLILITIYCIIGLIILFTIDIDCFNQQNILGTITILFIFTTSICVLTSFYKLCSKSEYQEPLEYTYPPNIGGDL